VRIWLQSFETDESSADPAWIGASADIILLALSVRRFGDGAWSWIG
jgi:hypothetical protein